MTPGRHEALAPPCWGAAPVRGGCKVRATGAWREGVWVSTYAAAIMRGRDRHEQHTHKEHPRGRGACARPVHTVLRCTHAHSPEDGRCVPCVRCPMPDEPVDSLRTPTNLHSASANPEVARTTALSRFVVQQPHRFKKAHHAHPTRTCLLDATVQRTVRRSLDQGTRNTRRRITDMMERQCIMPGCRRQEGCRSAHRDGVQQRQPS